MNIKLKVMKRGNEKASDFINIPVKQNTSEGNIIGVVRDVEDLGEQFELTIALKTEVVVGYIFDQNNDYKPVEVTLDYFN